MIGEMLKPLLQFTIMPMVENGNPADMLAHLTPILNADWIDPSTNTRFWSAKVTGPLKLEVNPHDDKYPVKVRQATDNALVLPLSPDAIKALVIKIIKNALKEPNVDQLTQDIKT